MDISNPILVEVVRGGLVESFHRGVICVVDENDQVIFQMGDIHQLCYPRSAMKLLQVIPLIESGALAHFEFSLEEIAVMCGSHNGEESHVRVVQSILKKIGLEAPQLRCGAQYPSSRHTTNELIRQHKKPEAIHNNCSGKHAGMLAMCVFMGWDTESYILPDHPLQQRIKTVCAEMYAYPAEKMITALDGCSAPIFSVPVLHQAIAYKNLVYPISFAASRQGACETIIAAVSAYPHMVAGTGRYCTDMMQITAPHIIGKTGAEGVFCMGFTEKKWGVCIKVDDGEMGPQYAIAQQIIEDSGCFKPEQLSGIHHYANDEIKNFNQLVTGETRTAFTCNFTNK